MNSQNNNSYIELRWNNTPQYHYEITVYQKVDQFTMGKVTTLEAMIDFLGKPNSFIWHNSHFQPITTKLINWLQTEFKELFDYDKFKWWASIATATPNIQPYLKNLFNNEAAQAKVNLTQAHYKY